MPVLQMKLVDNSAMTLMGNSSKYEEGSVKGGVEDNGAICKANVEADPGTDHDI